MPADQQVLLCRADDGREKSDFQSVFLFGSQCLPFLCGVILIQLELEGEERIIEAGRELSDCRISVTTVDLIAHLIKYNV